MIKTKTGLKDCSPQKVINLIEQMGEPSYRADQILDWLYKKKVSGFDGMTNLPTGLKEKLGREFMVNTLTMEEKLISAKDGTLKFLFSTPDNELIECAVMKQDYGNTVCISSQIGCKLGCVFCASTIGGMVRNLNAGEMLDQVILSEKHLEEGERIKNIVVMGMGEPLYNMNNLIKFLKTTNNPKGLGISLRNVTVSTAGIAPKINELGEHNLPITLAVSLHAPDDETRSKLMPVNKKYPLAEVIDSCKEYFIKTGRRVTFEYILIAGINDSSEKARALTRLIKKSGLTCHINLIPANSVDRHDIKSPAQKQVKNFHKVLEGSNISVSIRKERGEDIEGACGQLRRRNATHYP